MMKAASKRTRDREQEAHRAQVVWTLFVAAAVAIAALLQTSNRSFQRPGRAQEMRAPAAASLVSKDTRLPVGPRSE